MNIYPLLVDRIEADPSIVDRALELLDRWTEREVGPVHRRREWRTILSKAKESSAGMDALLAILRDDSEASRRLKDFAPFAGILSREERRKAFLQCSYDH